MSKINPSSDLERSDIGCRQYWYFWKLQALGCLFKKDFSLLVQINSKSRWTSFEKEIVLPCKHRLRLPNEVIFEYDNQTHNRATMLLCNILNEIKAKRNFSDIIVFIQDHTGRSPHLHCIALNKNTFDRLLLFSKKFAIDSQVNLSSRHMIRAEGGIYEKNNPVTYSSFFRNMSEIKPIYRPEDVVFPEKELEDVGKIYKI